MNKMIPQIRYILSAATALSLCLLCRAAHADIITLKNGNVVEGEVLEKRKGTVKVRLDIGTMTFREDEIESVEKKTVDWIAVRKEKAAPGFKGKSGPAPAKKPAVPSRVQWVYNFDRGMRKAKETGRPAMVDFYTDWCGWCKKLDKDTYTDKDVRALSAKFVPIKVDADRNKPLAGKYGVRGYPTILFLNPSGREIGRIGGYLPPESFLQRMRQYAR